MFLKLKLGESAVWIGVGWREREGAEGWGLISATLFHVDVDLPHLLISTLLPWTRLSLVWEGASSGVVEVEVLLVKELRLVTCWGIWADSRWDDEMACGARRFESSQLKMIWRKMTRARSWWDACHGIVNVMNDIDEDGHWFCPFFC